MRSGLRQCVGGYFVGRNSALQARGGIAKPRVVLYGEMLDENVIQKTLKYIDEAELLIIGGNIACSQPGQTRL